MIKKIFTVCGTGFGSSFFVELNIKKVLANHGLEQKYTVSHSALFDVNWFDVDYVVVARDLENSIPAMVEKVVLDSIIDMDELETKLLQVLGES